MSKAFLNFAFLGNRISMPDEPETLVRENFNAFNSLLRL